MDDPRDLALQKCFPVVAAPRFCELPEMENGQRLVVAANGIFVEVKLAWMHSLVKVGCAPEYTVPYGSVTEKLDFSFPYLPSALFDRFISSARMASPNETAGALIHSRSSGLVRFEHCTILDSSPTHLLYRAPDLPSDESLVMDLHSHGVLPAFWSMEDDRDDCGIKMCGVFGNLDRDLPSFQFRLCLNCFYRKLDIFAGREGGISFSKLHWA